MALLTLIQIPCHVLANEISLNLKYYINLKHFFNINLGIGIIKKTTFFVHIFDISPYVFTPIPSGRARWMRNIISHPTSTYTAYFFQVFLVFGVAGCIKSMNSRYLLDVDFNSTYRELSRLKFE